MKQMKGEAGEGGWGKAKAAVLMRLHACSVTRSGRREERRRERDHVMQWQDMCHRQSFAA
jgi:hypothetical protein